MRRYPGAVWVIYTLSRLSTAIVLMYKTLLINNVNDTVAEDPMMLWVATALIILLLNPRAFIPPKEMLDERKPPKDVAAPPASA